MFDKSIFDCTKVNISDLNGKTITNIEVDRVHPKIFLDCSDGTEYLLFRHEDWSEEQSILNINGDPQDLIGNPLLIAEEVTNNGSVRWIKNKLVIDCVAKPTKVHDESFTWKFYKLATIKGSVSLRWYVQSNSCYSREAIIFRRRKNISENVYAKN